MFIAFTAAWNPTDRSRALAHLVELTRERMQLTRAEFADQAGLTEKQLSDSLTLKRPMNLWRLADVADFFRVFLDVLAEAEGCLVFEKNLVSMILTVEQRPKPMARAALSDNRQEQAS